MIRDVIVLDTYLFDPINKRACASCDELFDGAAVIVRDGCIAEVRILRPGELESMIGPFESRPDTLVINSNGSLEPKPEWNDHVLDSSEIV